MDNSMDNERWIDSTEGKMALEETIKQSAEAVKHLQEQRKVNLHDLHIPMTI